MPPPLIKTVIDYSLTIIFLPLLIPVMLILAFIVRLSGEGPVIYSQERIGRFGKPFFIYKFRSMHFANNGGVPLVSCINDKRLTKIGRFMRKYKIDEIPNFINVLYGEMSLIGPRPEQKYYIDQIVLKAPQYTLIQTIKPGISSWGQVKYGYASNVDEMLERLDYDLYYMKNKSLWLDLKILYYTILTILKGEGI
ncbi:MAG: sugar transferase [Bacteroidales bacterium]|nr:sugar transferase [Bacteroidales bacterium]